MTISELLEDPARITDVTPAEIQALLAQVTATAAALAARLPAESLSTPTPTDRLLKPDEAAAILNVSVDFLRRSPSLKSLRVYLDRELRVSESALQTLIRRRCGRE